MRTQARLMVCVGVALLGACGAAFAQAEEREVQGSLDQPLGGVSQGSMYVHLVEDDGTTKYEVEIKDGRVTARIDGKRVPSKRVRRTDDAVAILDEQGNVLKEFKISTDPKVRAFTLGPGGQMQMLEPRMRMEAFPAPGQPEPPKVMLGIRMDDADEGVVVLADVLDGLPAAKAGLEAGDELVSIDGKKIEKASDVREAIKDKNPGDKVAVVVRRDGEEKTFEVTLEAWDRTALSGGEGLGQAWMELGESSRRLSEEARRALEKALKEIQESKAKEQFKKSWSEAMKQAIEALEKSKSDAMRWFQSDTGQFPRGRYLTPGERPTLFVTPDGQRGAVSRRLEELSKRLDEISERLDQINAALERLEQKKP